jgi:hypothetical protein
MEEHQRQLFQRIKTVKEHTKWCRRPHQLHFLKVVAESSPTASNIERPTEPEAAETSDTQSSQTYRPLKRKKRTKDHIG